MGFGRTTLVGAALALTVLLAACATATQDESPTPSADLLDTEWVLIALNGNALIEDTQITLNFEQVSLDGSAGCNTYGGSYTASEDGLRLSGVYATEMACPEPKGILDQEKAYLDALNAAARYRVDGDRLEVYDEAGAEILVFVASTSEALAAETPTASQPHAAAPTSTPVAVVVTMPTATQPNPPSPTPATEVKPVAPPPAAEPPAGFKPYQDAVAGLSVYVPESWVVTGVIPGQFAILQSFPETKYVGGEALQPGDTKCDLTIRPPGVDLASHIQQLKSDPIVTIVSESELVLQSGKPGVRFEVESMGRSLSLITEINERVVVLTCFGELEPFDAIAVTLGANG